MKGKVWKTTCNCMGNIKSPMTRARGPSVWGQYQVLLGILGASWNGLKKLMTNLENKYALYITYSN